MFKVYVRFTTQAGMVVSMTQDVTTASNAFGAVSAVETRVTDKYPSARINEMKVNEVAETAVESEG